MRDHESGEQFDLSRCEGCGLIWVNDPPRPDDLWTYYETDGGRAMHTAPSALFRTLRRIRLRRDFAGLRTVVGSGSTVLDFGSGDGSLALEMRSAGYQVEARDVYPEAAWPHGQIRYRRVDMGAPIVEDFMVNGRPAEALIMRHVLEHCPDPVALLGVIRSAGVKAVIAVVPNAESRLAGAFGPDWYYWDPPRHLFHFNRTSLQALARATGSRAVRMDFYGIDEVLSSLNRRARLARLSAPDGADTNGFLLNLTRPTGVLAGLFSGVTGIFSKGVVRVLLSFE